MPKRSEMQIQSRIYGQFYLWLPILAAKAEKPPLFTRFLQRSASQAIGIGLGDDNPATEASVRTHIFQLGGLFRL